MDGLAYVLKVTANIQICETENFQPQRFQILGPLGVFLHFRCIVMLGAVQLYNQFSPMAIKIGNVWPDDVLSSKLEGVAP